MLFVELILAAHKLWVKLERLVSMRIIHLETCLNEDVGCWQATKPQGEILFLSCLHWFAISHLCFTFTYILVW
jgi:hypothetical protein